MQRPSTKFTFKEYVDKILNLLNDEGYLMFETVSPDTYEPRLFEPKFQILSSVFTILDDIMVESEYQNGKGHVRVKPTGTLGINERPASISNNIDAKTIKRGSIHGNQGRD